MKYIDAEKLKETINKQLQENADKACLFGAAFAGRAAEDNDIINLIDFLKEEYPSIPSDIDEAAKEIAYSVCRQLPNGKEKDNIVYYAILAAKAGAEWVAEQIVNKINSI